MNKAGILKLILVLLLLTKVLNAQETVVDEESLNFTYMGPSISSAYNYVEYTDWFKTSTKTKKTSGFLFSGGVALSVFADELCGDFQIHYAYDQLDTAVTYLEFIINGKYYYPLDNYVSLGGGLGLYLDTPPSNVDHNGSAGVQIPLSVLINTTPGSKLFIDIVTRYGSFGIGENTKAISVGINAGFVFKVGRI